MEQVLLWVSLAVGLVLYLCRFLPSRSGAEDTSGAADSPDVRGSAAVRNVALAIPVVGFLLSLPTSGGGFFHEGQRLGIGFLIGGVATILGHLDLLFARSDRATHSAARSTVLVTSSYGMNLVAVVAALIFLRQSLFDALIGVAIGGFCVSFLLFLSAHGANSRAARRIAVGAGMLTTLAAAASLGIFRDGVTPELAKQTWSAVTIAFAAVGTLLVTGTTLLGVRQSGGIGRILPLTVLTAVGGLGLFLMATRITDTRELALIGLGGLLLWPVALSVLRETNGGRGAGTTPVLSAPLLAVLVVTSGFLAALQSLQGVGAAIGVLALFIAYPATLMISEGASGETAGPPTSAESNTVANGAVGLLLFSALLLLWRLFATRWAGDLRGVNLSDQYALFGLLVGAALPGVLAAIPRRVAPDKFGAGAGMIGAIALCAILALAAPAAVLVLFGAKSAVALMIGLALGAVPVLSGGSSLLPGLLAVAVALALNQFTGTILPDETPTRAEKIRYLAVIMSAIVVAVVLANRVGGRNTKDGNDSQ